MLAMILAAAAAAIPPGYVEAKRLDLTAAFHTKTAWTMSILKPTGAEAETGDRPIEVCLTGGRDGRTHCTKVAANGYPFQGLESATIEPLSNRSRVEGVVVKATFAGVSRTLTRIATWTYDGQGLADDFLETAHFELSDQGEAEPFASGAMDGYFVKADFVDTYPGETRWSDHRFAISVYRLDPRVGAYLEVLQYVTARRYQAEREVPLYVIPRELPRVRQLLHTVYPAGPPT
jgi:hypothetical protein